MKFPGRKPSLHGIVREQERRRRAEQKTQGGEPRGEPEIARTPKASVVPQSFDASFANAAGHSPVNAADTPALGAGIGPSDIWRHADRLMQMHGEDAALVAADLAGARFADGDLDGFTLWIRIGEAIMDLSRQTPGCTDCVN